MLYLFIFLDFVYDPLRKRVCTNSKVSRKGNRDIAIEEVRYGVIVFGKQVASNDSKGELVFLMQS
jgi:hypothetical protein